MNIPYIFLEIDFFRDEDEFYFYVYKDGDGYINIESNYFLLQIFKINSKLPYIRNGLIPRLFKYIGDPGKISLLKFSFMNLYIEMQMSRK